MGTAYTLTGIAKYGADAQDARTATAAYLASARAARSGAEEAYSIGDARAIDAASALLAYYARETDRAARIAREALREAYAYSRSMYGKDARDLPHGSPLRLAIDAIEERALYANLDAESCYRFAEEADGLLRDTLDRPRPAPSLLARILARR